jgi:hypothetical protein
METVEFEVELSRVKLKAVRTENQRLHIELGNSESEKELLGNKCRNCDRNLRLAHRSGEDWGRTLGAKRKFCSGRHTFSEVNTRRGHNFQPTWQIWNSLWRFYKAEATKLYSNPLTKWLQYCNCK